MSTSTNLPSPSAQATLFQQQPFGITSNPVKFWLKDGYGVFPLEQASLIRFVEPTPAPLAPAQATPSPSPASAISAN